MLTTAQIKPISYLKANAAEVLQHLTECREPMVITQNGEASMVIQAVQQFQEKEALIAALKIMALGEKDRTAGKGISASESRAQLKAARQSRK